MWNRWQAEGSRIHSTIYSGHCFVNEELIKLRCMFTLIDDRLFPRRNGARCCWIADAAAAVDSLSPSLLSALPCGQTGMVYSKWTCHCHSGGDGSRSVRAEGGEGRLHPLPAIAVRRLLLLWSHTGKTLPFLFCDIFTNTPWGPLCLRRWMGFLVYPWVRCLWEYISL